MVHFPGFARARLWIHRAVRGVYPRGFPHSEIPGSMPACGSPRLIAACHVLHRLLLPRHPPCALSSLTIKFTRHTAVPLPPSSFRRNAFRKTTKRRENLMGLDPAHRMQHRKFPLRTSVSSVVKAFDFDLSDTKAQKKPAPHTPAGFLQALIKIYVSPCNLPNLFSCQISSSLTCVSYPAYAGMSLTNPGVCKLPSSSNPMFGAKHLASNIRQDSGGADRDRTGGLLVANQALSQLSYSP